MLNPLWSISLHSLISTPMKQATSILFFSFLLILCISIAFIFMNRRSFPDLLVNLSTFSTTNAIKNMFAIILHYSCRYLIGIQYIDSIDQYGKNSYQSVVYQYNSLPYITYSLNDIHVALMKVYSAGIDDRNSCVLQYFLRTM